MSYRFNDGYLRPGNDGYVRFFKDGYTAFLTHDGYNIALFTSSGTVFDSAKGIAFIANRTTAPDGYQPTDGGWLYAEGGDGYWVSSRGPVQAFTASLSTPSIPTDADYTAVIADYRARIMEFASGVTLTNTRNVIMPNFKGQQWTVFNNTTGGQSIVLKVTGQTGVTIANAKRAIVYCNGTDIVRVTPDT